MVQNQGQRRKTFPSQFKYLSSHRLVWPAIYIYKHFTMSCWGVFMRRHYQFSTLLKLHHLNAPVCQQRGFHPTTAYKTYDVRKVELMPLEQRKLTFDSHALVKELEASGFEKRQAEVIVTALVTLTSANMDIVYRDMVTGNHQEIALQQIMAHLDSIRKDMVILEKSEFANLRSENVKMKTELEQIRNRLLEESQRIRADAKLDINLERSRVTDMFTDQEKNLMEVRTEFQKQNAEIENEAGETSRKIDIQVASLKTLLESLKLQTIQYLAACIFTCLAIALGFYRLWI